MEGEKELRKDQKRNISKVAKELLKDPLQTTREIEAKTGVSKSTVATAIKKLDTLGQKDDRIVGICDNDIKNVELGQNILQKRLQEKADELRTSDIVQIMNEGTKRYTIFKGDITNDEGGMKMLSQDKLDALLDRLEIDDD